MDLFKARNNFKFSSILYWLLNGWHWYPLGLSSIKKRAHQASTYHDTLSIHFTGTKSDNKLSKTCLVKSLSVGNCVTPIQNLCSVVQMWHTRMDRLPPLFIIIIGLMEGKSERSEIPAYHGRFLVIAHSWCNLRMTTISMIRAEFRAKQLLARLTSVVRRYFPAGLEGKLKIP